MGKRLGVERKYQVPSGTAEEKIPAPWPIPDIVAIEGEDFSSNVQGYSLSTGKVTWCVALIGCRMSNLPVPRSFLKWSGGKTQLTDTLLERMPLVFNICHDPFARSDALFFRLYREQRIRQAVLSDLNAELIDTYLATRDCVPEVIRLLSEFPHDEEFYYAVREKTPGG